MSRRIFSSVWDYYQRTDGGTKCLIAGCGKVLKCSDTSTKAYWSHLRSVHKAAFWAAKKKDSIRNGREEAENPLDQKKEESEVQVVGGKGKVDSVLATTEPNGSDDKLLQVTIEESVNALKKSDGSRNDKILALIVDADPVVENSLFRDIIKAAYPKMEKPLPHRRYFSDNLLEQQSSAMINEFIGFMREGPFAITSDIWSSNTDSLLSVTAHMVTEGFERKNVVLAAIPCGDKTHTGENIAELIRGVLEKHGIPETNLFALVRDGAPNMVKASKLLDKDQNSFQCAAHSLHNTVNGSVEEDNNVKAIMRKARATAAFFNRSPYAKNVLAEELKKRKMRVALPVQDVRVRWNSSLHMLASVLHIQPVLTSVTARIPSSRNKLHPNAFSASEHYLAERIISVLSVLENQSKLLCCEDATCSSVIPVFSVLSAYLSDAVHKKTNEMIRRFIQSLKRRLEGSLAEAKEKTILRLAVYVDPRYSQNKTLFTDKEWSFIEKEAKDLFNALTSKPVATRLLEEGEDENRLDDDGLGILVNDVTASSDGDLWKSFRRGSSHNEKSGDDVATEFDEELKRFGRSEKASLDDNVYNWFRKKRESYPGLLFLAQRFLAVPPTSVSSERLFSRATLLSIDWHRNKLKPEKVEQILILKGNGFGKRMPNTSRSQPILFPQTSNSTDDNSEDEILESGNEDLELE